MNFKKLIANIRGKPDERLIILTTPLPSQSSYRIWWEDVRKRLKNDPHYLPIKPIPSEKELKEIELD